jgi:hypothetical protein
VVGIRYFFAAVRRQAIPQQIQMSALVLNAGKDPRLSIGYAERFRIIAESLPRLPCFPCR